MDTLPPGLANGVGVVVVVLLVGWLVWTGRLVTRREVDAMHATYEEIIADKNERLTKQEALITNLADQNALMLSSAMPTVNSVLTALRQAAGEST
jgi:hypothetical protein